jgi:ArsR family transcriptional regulator, arsenate/arsenite/antimonite-responsive transcriptional repressor / arsenate reductase (thioredoxin)
MYRLSMASDGNSPALPLFLQLAGHELRWQLLRELAGSDRRVRELVSRLDQPQNLVSYHLGKLRTAGLVATQRSSADGRDVYYHLDLRRCAELLGETADALHPGLRAQGQTRLRKRRGGRIQVLFLCTGNSARSPMAVALLRHHTDGLVHAVSAGSHPRPIDPHAVRAVAEYGLDLSKHRSRRLDAYVDKSFDYVISLCDRVREVCPRFPDRPAYIHWSIPNPASADAESGSDAVAAAYRRTAAELDTRIRFLVPRLGPSHSSAQ